MAAVPLQVALELEVFTGMAWHQLIGCPSWLKLIVPPSTCGEMVAVKLSGLPTATGLAEDVRLIVVAAVGMTAVGSELTEVAPAALTAVTSASSCDPMSAAATV
jgi:hypothetical protein